MKERKELRQRKSKIDADDLTFSKTTSSKLVPGAKRVKNRYQKAGDGHDVAAISRPDRSYAREVSQLIPQRNS
jgi:hypothetical protein